jgi:hypothetical protein
LQESLRRSQHLERALDISLGSIPDGIGRSGWAPRARPRRDDAFVELSISTSLLRSMLNFGVERVVVLEDRDDHRVHLRADRRDDAFVELSIRVVSQFAVAQRVETRVHLAERDDIRIELRERLASVQIRVEEP